MINNKISCIWFISSIVMDNFLHHRNIFICISNKKKEKLFPSYNLLFSLSEQNRTLFARCVLLSLISLILVCLVICLVVYIIDSFPLCFIDEKKTILPLFFCHYHKLSHFSFHIKIKQRSSFYFDVSFLSFGKVICICTYSLWAFVCLCCPFLWSIG